jgi:hypothetical protein
MQINYRVLSVDETESSMIVRYWTDELSEKELSVDPEESSDTPAQCRTDYNISISDHSMSEEALHEFIISCAPVDWFNLKHKIKDPSVDTSLSVAKALVGVDRSGAFNQNVAKRPAPRVHEDITALLSEPDAKVDGEVFLWRVRKKTNDGPWTHPPKFTHDEMDSIVLPYARAQYSACKGILGQPNVFFESSDVFVRQYRLVSLEAARALLAFAEDVSIPEVRAMRDLSKRHADAAGTTYLFETRLTRLV